MQHKKMQNKKCNLGVYDKNQWQPKQYHMANLMKEENVNKTSK
jgi:hypothetical protein